MDDINNQSLGKYYTKLLIQMLLARAKLKQLG